MFRRLGYTLARFMYGRYGSDRFNRFLMVLYLIFWVLSVVFRGWTGLIFYALTTVTMVWTLFRMLSRNIPRRQAEEQWFLRWWGPTEGWMRRQGQRLKDIRRCRYRICPACKAQLRLPIKRGRRTVTCSRCRAQFRTFFL